MTNFTPVSSALGGILIGVSAALLLFSHGRIAGISGIVGGLMTRPVGDTDWRWAFIAGLVTAGLVAALFAPGLFSITIVRSPWIVVLAGLLVGVGARMGSGCTSGHGVCGISRLSLRSIVATLVFLVAGVATVLVTQ